MSKITIIAIIVIFSIVGCAPPIGEYRGDDVYKNIAISDIQNSVTDSLVILQSVISNPNSSLVKVYTVYTIKDVNILAIYYITTDGVIKIRNIGIHENLK